MQTPLERFGSFSNDSLEVPGHRDSGKDDHQSSSDESLRFDHGSADMVSVTCDSGEDEQQLEVGDALQSKNDLSSEVAPLHSGGSDVQRSPAKDFILNLPGHYEEIKALELAVVSYYPLTTFLELSQQSNSWIAQTEKMNIKDPNWKDGIDVDVKELQRTKQLSEATLAGLDLLTARGFAGDRYNILVLDPARSSVAHIVPVSRKTVVSLIVLTDMVLEAMQMDSEALPTAFERTTSAVALLEQAAQKILQHLHFPDKNANFSWLRRDQQLHIIVTRILFLGLVSYISSHTGHFDENYFGKRCEKIVIYSGIEGIVFRRRRLACLDSFVGQTVWVFEDPSFESVQSELYLSCLISDLADIWGKARLVYSDNTLDMVVRIHMGSGIIFAKPLGREPSESSSTPANPPTVNTDEILCHWSNCLEVDPRGNDDHIPFQTTKRLLIGASHFLRNDNCQSVKAVASSRHFLGTEEPCFRIDTRSASLSISKIVGVGISESRRLYPGTTLKSLVVEEWVEHWGDPMPYNPDPLWLDIYAGLEISACTGNAQRVHLWQLLRVGCMVDYVVRTFCHDKDREMWKKRYEAFFYGYKSFADLWRSQPVARGILRPVISNVLIKLSKTGIDEDGRVLRAWDPISGVSEHRITPNWKGMLKDSSSCGTFAIVADCCLEYTKGRQCLRAQPGSAKVGTVLLTRLSLFMHNEEHNIASFNQGQQSELGTEQHNSCRNDEKLGTSPSNVASRRDTQSAPPTASRPITSYKRSSRPNTRNEREGNGTIDNAIRSNRAKPGSAPGLSPNYVRANGKFPSLVTGRQASISEDNRALEISTKITDDLESELGEIISQAEALVNSPDHLLLSMPDTFYSSYGACPSSKNKSRYQSEQQLEIHNIRVKPERRKKRINIIRLDNGHGRLIYRRNGIISLDRTYKRKPLRLTWKSDPALSKFTDAVGNKMRQLRDVLFSEEVLDGKSCGVHREVMLLDDRNPVGVVWACIM